MKEITGNLWDFHGYHNTVICLTTNGTVKANGEGVMGRGNALEATQRFPGIAAKLGDRLMHRGNHVEWLFVGVLMFPVKHQWFERADLELIARSVQELQRFIEANPRLIWILPRPGVGNGKLDWKDVKPLLEKLPDSVYVITFEKQEASNGSNKENSDTDGLATG